MVQDAFAVQGEHTCGVSRPRTTLHRAAFDRADVSQLRLGVIKYDSPGHCIRDIRTHLGVFNDKIQMLGPGTRYMGPRTRDPDAYFPLKGHTPLQECLASNYSREELHNTCESSLGEGWSL